MGENDFGEGKVYWLGAVSGEAFVEHLFGYALQSFFVLSSRAC